MRHALLAHGCSTDLLAWLDEARPDFVDGGVLPRLQRRYGAFWFERLLAAQAVPPPVAAPVAFILGFWRSGTTLLHNCLYAGWQCRTPLSWECFSPASFRLQSPPRADRATPRPMDDGVVRLLGPQEDEFAALLLGEPSLYRGFLDPNRLDQLAADAATPASYARWHRFVTSLPRGEGEPLLLKSPNHSFRLPALAAQFPSSRHVWIGRGFGDVVRSNLAMWSAMAARHALTRFPPDVIERFVVRMAAAYAAVLRDLLVSPGSLLWIDFDDLVARPEYETSRAAEYLGFAPRTAAARVAVAADPAVHASRAHGGAADVGVARIVAEVDRLHTAARARFAG